MSTQETLRIHFGDEYGEFDNPQFLMFETNFRRFLWAGLDLTRAELGVLQEFTAHMDFEAGAKRDYTVKPMALQTLADRVLHGDKSNAHKTVQRLAKRGLVEIVEAGTKRTKGVAGTCATYSLAPLFADFFAWHAAGMPPAQPKTRAKAGRKASAPVEFLDDLDAAEDAADRAASVA